MKKTNILRAVVGLGLLTVAACAGPEADELGQKASAVQGSGRYIVKFRDQVRGRSALAAHGGKVALDLDRQNAAAAHIPAVELEALRNDPDVEYIEEDPIRKPLSQTVPYGITMVQANLVSDASAANRTICIIDSGYSIQHEDLSDSSVTGSNTAGTGNWYDDDCGHGSHVAGTISALDNNVGVVGVLGHGNIKLHIVKVFSGESCAWTYASTLVNALNLCTAAGANVVSMSLGGGSASTTEQTAFQNAYNSGVLSIAAAGNGGTGTGTVDAVSYPAGYSSVVSVAAIDVNKAHADFSQENSDVEISAPGVAVESSVPYLENNTLTVASTSFAGGRIDGAARSAGTPGALVDGGLCTAAGSWTGKVVICQRGSISFNDKVINVKAGGGVAAVIYNNAPGNFNGTLGDGVTSTIPAISLSDTDGAAALAFVTQIGTVVSARSVSSSSYQAWDGTSMATPHVSGVAALVWSNNPACSNAQIRAALTATAQDLGSAGRDITFGYGLVQAQAATNYLAAGCGATGGDTTAPVISNVKSLKTSSNGSFKISWTTDEASDSTVLFVGGSSFNTATLVTSHSLSFRGARGATYQYYVSSKDAAGNTATSGPYTHKN